MECDTYIEYDVLNNVVWGYSYTWDWMYYGVGGIGVYLELDTPVQQYNSDDTNEYLYAEVDFEGWDGDGQYWAYGSHEVDFGPNGNTYDQVTAIQPLPTGETTAAGGWAGDGRGIWNQTLTGESTWNGTSVQETDPGGGGPDTCWFQGSDFEPFESVTGGKWGVGSGNAWGPDLVGYFDDAIMYYSDHARTPCGTSFPQQMQIYTSSGWKDYVRNTLGGWIDIGYVTSIRAGHSQTR